MNLEPLAKGIRDGHPGLNNIAAELGISVTLLMLRWSFTKGLCTGLPAGNASVTNIIDSKAGLEGIYVKLSSDIMEQMETFEEGLTSVWVPVEPSGDEEEGNGQ